MHPRNAAAARARYVGPVKRGGIISLVSGSWAIGSSREAHGSLDPTTQTSRAPACHGQRRLPLWDRLLRAPGGRCPSLADYVRGAAGPREAPQRANVAYAFARQRAERARRGRGADALRAVGVRAASFSRDSGGSRSRCVVPSRPSGCPEAEVGRRLRGRPYPQRFGPARCTPPFVSHHCRTASCEEPDSVHAPFAYSPPAWEQIAAESAQPATQRMVTTRAAPIPVTALAHCLSTGGCRSSP